MKNNYFSIAGILYLIYMFLLPSVASGQCTPVDHGGANLIISSNDTLGGEHTNIKKFQVMSGVTLFVRPSCKFLIIHADTIIVAGIINGNAAGELGGSGGLGGAMANGSGNPGYGGAGGGAGLGPGGGSAGSPGGNGGYITQICGNFLCIGNRDGLNGGGGGGGGGSGAAYGGTGGVGGWGGYGTGFTGAAGGSYGLPGAAVNPYGTEDGIDIAWGSGGGGAGGGGGGWANGTNGGAGGRGGAMVRLNSNGPMTIIGSIFCNGGPGQPGGNGGGASTNNAYSCTSSGYNECSIFCSQSVFDAPGGAGGGGGGGSGGGILLQANGPMNITGFLHAKGGDGGVAGLPVSTYGACFDDGRGGGSGSGGRIKIFSNPCYTHNINPNVSVIAGVGGTGIVPGIHANPGTYRGDLITPSYTPLTAGTISLTDPVFCFYGDVPNITSTAPASGGVPGLINYQWQYSITSATAGFSNIPGQTSATLDPGIITQTTWYRRKATSGLCEEYSNVVVATVLDCSDINENEANNLVVYPNPSTDGFNIELPQTSSKIMTIRILNILGQKVFEKTIENQSATSQTIWLNPNLPIGNYFISLITEDAIFKTRISIQK